MDQFAEFLKERKYLLNVSPATIVYYQCAFKAWQKHSNGDSTPVAYREKSRFDLAALAVGLLATSTQGTDEYR